MSRELLVSDLRAWASVAWQRASPSSAALIQKAANAIKSGVLDVGLAAELMAYSCLADRSGKATLSEVLLRAGDALTPRLTDIREGGMPGKAGRPRSIVWDLVEPLAEARS